MRKKLISLAIIIIITNTIFLGNTELAGAQVPVNVWGYVYMPDGTPAAGAQVTISAGGVTKSTTTNSDGKYGPVTLTVSSTPVKITVKASKGDYSGSNSKTGEGTVRIDVQLKTKPKPPPPPPPPPPSPPKPEKKSVSINLSVPQEGFLNESIKINGTVTPKVTPIHIRIKSPQGNVTEAQVDADEEGRFVYFFTATIPGTYLVSAYFPGNDEYKSASTSEYEIKILARSVLKIQVSPSVVMAGAEEVTISGYLFPPSREKVLIYYSPDNKSWILLEEVDASHGSFSIRWKPKAFGEVFIKVEWPGNETYAGSVAYARVYTVLPSVVSINAHLENEIITVKSNVNCSGAVYGVVNPEKTWIEITIYREGVKVKSLRVFLTENGEFSFNYTPELPGVYVFLFKTGGQYNIQTTDTKIIYVLGEVEFVAVNSSGQVINRCKIRLQDVEGRVISASESGRLKATLRIGRYSVSVFINQTKVFEGLVNITAGGITLLHDNQTETYPLPLAVYPLQINLKIKTYSLRVMVVNAFGEPAKGIEVTVKSNEKTLSGKTNSQGFVTFSNLITGTYEVATPAEKKIVKLDSNTVIVLRSEKMNSKMTLYALSVALMVTIVLSIIFAWKYVKATRK